MKALADQLTTFVNDARRELGRRGAVVGVSGGVDSAVTLALTARALGPERVLALALPERESSSTSLSLASRWAADLGVEFVVEDLTSALEGLGCYRRRDEAVAQLIPEYRPGVDTMAVRLIQNVRSSKMPALYSVVVNTPSGDVLERRMNARAYRQIFAASNYKQRLRTATLYHHAEARGACVVGTSNLDEEYLGFFVKIGDGTWDACPIESLTKTTVRRLAEYLNVPADIIGRPTTTDTFPVEEQSQEDMFYSLPFAELDPLLEVLVGRRTRESAVTTLGWSEAEVDNALHNLRRRHRATEWNRTMSLRPQVTHDAVPLG